MTNTPLNQLEVAAHRFATEVIPDEAIADTIGRLDYLVTQLTKFSRDLKAEADVTLDGEHYQWEREYSNTYSFNMRSLIGKALEAKLVAEAAGKTPATIGPEDVAFLMWQEGVLKPSNWTAIEKFAARYNMPLTITQSEVNDDSDYGDVGKVGKERWKLTGKEEK